MSSIDSFFDALEDEDVPQPWTTPGPVAQRPPRLLLTLLGDYWWQRTESLPSAAIVGLLAEFGVSDSAARAALSRLTRNGLLVTSRSGRRTFVRLSRRAADVLDDGGRRIFSFGATPAPWDGMWSLVAFSIPEEHRSARDELRKELRWLGFAPLYDGLWVCPRDHAGRRDGPAEGPRHRHRDRVPRHRAARRHPVGAVGRAAAGTARGADAGTLVSADIPARAWDLSGLRDRYQEFIEFAGLLRDQTVAGEITTADALVARTRVMNEWRAFPAMDPDLPDELLPPGVAAGGRPRPLHHLLRPARPARRQARPADHRPLQSRAGRPRRLPQLPAHAVGRRRLTAPGSGLPGRSAGAADSTGRSTMVAATD